jgi:glyoxylase-like metal-dependent hydrolase (beta-lactamase superfamily II)
MHPEHHFWQMGDGLFSLGQKKGGRVHAFLVEDQGKLTLIDTLYDTDASFIVKVIQQMGRKVDDLENIIITHAHRSHLGGLADLKTRSKATVWAHEWESDIIAGQRKAQAVPFFPRRPYRTSLRVWFPFQFGLALGLGPHPACEVDEFLTDGDSVGPLTICHAPGHSPGRLSIFWKERRTLFAGDSIATWPDLSLGWPAFNLNKRQHYKSLHKIMEFDPEIIAVGHGEPATGEQVAQLHEKIQSARPDGLP